MNDIRGKRRSNQIPKELSIVRDIDKREIKIYTDAGRCQRAMFIVEDNELKIRKKHVYEILKQNDKWEFEQYIKEGLVELLDVAEEETAMIAMFVKDVIKNRDS